MRVNFRVVPPGGGEGDYSFLCEMPAVPRIGDYVTAVPSDDGISAGSGLPEAFLVRCVWWNTKYQREGVVALQSDDDAVTCVVEEVPHGFDMDERRQRFERYRANGRQVHETDNSGY